MEPLAAEVMEEVQVTAPQLPGIPMQPNDQEGQGDILQRPVDTLSAAMTKGEQNPSDTLTMRLPKSYMPDIDTWHRLRPGPGDKGKRPFINSQWVEKELLKQICYSFGGERTTTRSWLGRDISSWDEADSGMTSDIEIYFISKYIEFLTGFSDCMKIISFLGVAPCLYWQIADKGHFGLGRRFVPPNGDVKGKKKHESGNAAGSYHIWFILPGSSLEAYREEKRNPAAEAIFDMLHIHSIHFPFIGLSFHERMRCFYMKVDLQSRSTRILINFNKDAIEKFCDVCEKGFQQEDYDPFIFLCSSVSELLHGWVEQGLIYFGKIREIEAKVLALGKSFDEAEQHRSTESRGTERKKLQDARNLMLQLHELCSYQLRQNRNLGYLSNIINESIKEHHESRETLEINPSTFLEVHKNLCTLASWVQGVKQNLESTQKVTDSCLSTLSLLLNMRNNHSVEENTKFLATMAEHGSKENYQVKGIAEATQKDSEAMKTIAMMTMFYLPASFVATLFSMGMFNFDFESGRNGTISLSGSWWIYAVVTIPLTISTFLFFWFMQKRHQNQGKTATVEKIQ